MTDVVVTPRLDLVSLNPEFLRASLAGQTAEAAARLNARLPADWPVGHERVLERRLTQLEANPADQPWLVRAIVLRDPTTPAPQDLPNVNRLQSGEFDPAFAKVHPLIGLIGFHAPPDAAYTVEVGYRIEPDYRSHGYATEAVQALFAWATRRGGVQRFRASISPSNEPSLRLIKKLGFHQTRQQHDEIDGLELVFERHAVTPNPYTSDEDTT